jgi:hypothetical protein
MRLPLSLRLNNRRGLLVYQLVIILIAIIILIVVLLYVARRNQLGTSSTSAYRSPSGPTMLMTRESGRGVSVGQARYV